MLKKEQSSELEWKILLVHRSKIWPAYFQTTGPWEDSPAVYDEMAKSDSDRQHSQKWTIANPELALSALLE